MNQRTILITGAGGFVGSHLAEKYANQGDTVRILDDFSTGSISNIRSLLTRRNVKLMRGDVRDTATVDKAVEGADIILHLAAQVHVDKSIVSPRSTFDVNTLGTLNILDSAIKSDTQVVVYASSSESYGSAQYVPMDEKHPLNPGSPYAASKAAADRLCYSYYNTYRLPVVIVRCFNTYGPRQSNTGYAGVIPKFIKRAMQKLPPIIYGDGKQTRDYMYIQDAVRAYDLVLNSFENLLGLAINFGTGREITINELASKVLSLLELEGKLSPIHVDPRPGEVKRLCADISEAKNRLGFEPKYDIASGLQETVNWYTQGHYEEWLAYRE